MTRDATRLDRRHTTLIGAGALVVLLVLVLLRRPEKPPIPVTSTTVASSAPSLVFSPPPPPSFDLPLEDAPLPSAALAPSAHALPAGAPKTVRIGVLLYQYRGAQFAPEGARSKRDAWESAKNAVEPAKKSWKAAVKAGDPGSAEDIGKIGRGILEPWIESAVFALPVGAVSEPVDTPRGYWVVRRIE